MNVRRQLRQKLGIKCQFCHFIPRHQFFYTQLFLCLNICMKIIYNHSSSNTWDKYCIILKPLFSIQHLSVLREAQTYFFSLVLLPVCLWNPKKKRTENYILVRELLLFIHCSVYQLLMFFNLSASHLFFLFPLFIIIHL